MTPEEYNWTINLVKDRYYQFKPSFEQAEKIYLFEQQKDLHSEEYFFSSWEEDDYTLDNFQKIFNDKQFNKFIKWHKSNIKRHEQFLIDNDKEQLKYIEYYHELIDFYEKKYVPDFFKEQFLTESVALSIYKSKVTFLKNEYKAYLDNEMVGRISSHYRHYRLFMPNQLKATSLRHKLSYIVPNFSSFKIKMDNPTKCVAQFLLDKFQYISERHEKFFIEKEEQMTSFAKEILDKYIGEIKGWHTTITATEEQIKENRIMQVVLLDKEKYGS